MMPQIKIDTVIKADIKSCFNIARNIDIHQESLRGSGKIAIAGRTSGLIELSETVTWEANHFGLVQHLTSKITEYEYPNYFVDEMVSGAFKSFRHEHHFKRNDKKTVMTDVFYFELPYGTLGKLANWLFLKKYMRNLLQTRNSYLKELAESI
ncbi:SRPBCC family protein [Mariniflexile sp.]|uniref:SRPBCC family protein n=1 Tax=Mariniflexile sp. TaxID=1979402 RepID=UPI004048BE32